MNDNEIIEALERLSAEDPDGFSAVCERRSEK